METPSILTGTYEATAYNALGGPWGDGVAFPDSAVEKLFGRKIIDPRIPMPVHQMQVQQEEKEMANPTTRLVQVFIADPDENVPLDKRILYKGDQKVTDLTDQELFFDIGIGPILETHNKLRATLINKKIKERTEYLEPARIRDLKMVVVSIASF